MGDGDGRVEILLQAARRRLANGVEALDVAERHHHRRLGVGQRLRRRPGIADKGELIKTALAAGALRGRQRFAQIEVRSIARIVRLQSSKVCRF